MVHSEEDDGAAIAPGVYMDQPAIERILRNETRSLASSAAAEKVAHIHTGYWYERTAEDAVAHLRSEAAWEEYARRTPRPTPSDGVHG